MDYSHFPYKHISTTINSLLRSIHHGLKYPESPQRVDEEMTTWDHDDDGEDVEGADDDGETGNEDQDESVPRSPPQPMPLPESLLNPISPPSSTSRQRRPHISPSALQSGMGEGLFSHSSDDGAHQPDKNTLYMALQQHQALVQMLQQQLDEANSKNAELSHCLQQTQLDGQKQMEEFCRQLEELRLQQVQSRVDEESYPNPTNDPASTEEALPGDHLDKLRQEAFDYIPPTVTQRRGAALYDTHDQPFDFVTDPVRHVYFAEENVSSTQQRPQLNIPDVSHIQPPRDLQSKNHKDNYMPAPRKYPTPPMLTTNNSLDASLAAVAPEFKKVKDPKITKLEGGYSSDASLFFNNWEKDIRACVVEQNLSDTEAIQLVKECIELNALKEIQFYLDLSPSISFRGLIDHL